MSDRREKTLVKPDNVTLPASFREPDSFYGAIGAFIVFAPIFFLIGVAPLLYQHVHPILVIFIIPVLGVYIYKITIVMHDCAHNTLFRGKAANHLFGTIGGYFLGSDFEAFTANHFAHHRNYGVDGDPQGADYLNLQGKGRHEILWHLLRPLIGYNLFKLWQFAPELPDGDTPKPSTPAAPPRRASRTKFVAGVLVVQGTIALLATGFGAAPYLVVLYPLSAATFALFLSQLRGFAEHVADEGQPEESSVRTHLPNLFDRFFFYHLNFNYHVEHHLYPYVPSCHLSEVHDLIKEECHDDRTISNSILLTVRRRIETCHK